MHLSLEMIMSPRWKTAQDRTILSSFGGKNRKDVPADQKNAILYASISIGETDLTGSDVPSERSILLAKDGGRKFRSGAATQHRSGREA